jgi:prolyl 4-hydroxylase
VVQLPANNSGDLEFLKYEPGQFYKIHHDYVDDQIRSGPRALTFFIYLTDVARGGTDFPHLNVTIQPKQGRAVLWSNVYDSTPMQKDPRMEHQGMAVEGEMKKYASAMGYYLYDFLAAQAEGCL